MANLIDQKLSSTDFSGKNIQALPTKPTITAEQLKERFDYAAEQVVAPKHNALVDILTDTTAGVSGAEQVGSAPISGVAGDTVHEQMADLKYQFDNVLLDPRVLPDGSVTTEKLMDEAVTLEKLDPDALAWNNISSKPAAYTPSAHSHAAGDLPAASTTAVGVVQLDSLVNSTSETRAATSLAVKTVNDKATQAYNAISQEATTSVQPNYNVTNTTVTTYFDGMLRLVIFAEECTGETPTLEFGNLGAKPLFLLLNKYFKPKYRQRVFVQYNAHSDCFFVCSAGGGIEYPSTILAGTTPILIRTDTIWVYDTTWTVKRTFTAHKACVVRVYYTIHANRNASAAGKCFGKIQRGTTDVAGSSVYSQSNATNLYDVSATVDVTLSAGETLNLLMYYTQGETGFNDLFVVSILATELQAAHNAILS